MMSPFRTQTSLWQLGRRSGRRSTGRSNSRCLSSREQEPDGRVVHMRSSVTRRRPYGAAQAQVFVDRGASCGSRCADTDCAPCWRWGVRRSGDRPSAQRVRSGDCERRRTHGSRLLRRVRRRRPWSVGGQGKPCRHTNSTTWASTSHLRVRWRCRGEPQTSCGMGGISAIAPVWKGIRDDREQCCPLHALGNRLLIAVAHRLRPPLRQ